jgi:DNA-binding SARP family transcriptional activator
MPLRFNVVGSVQVSTARRIVGESELHGPQGRLVLAMLVSEHRRRVGRDELAEELWPTTVQASWETAVRVVVSKIRVALQPVVASPLELIEPANRGYRFRLPADGSVDLDEAAAAVHEAEAELGAGSVDAAGADALVASMITTRPFLPDAAGPWATATRERVAEIRLRSLMCLGEVWLAKGDYGQAARDAESVLRLDPYRESAHRLLMRTCGGGDRAAAAHAYRGCRPSWPPTSSRPAPGNRTGEITGPVGSAGGR